MDNLLQAIGDGTAQETGADLERWLNFEQFAPALLQGFDVEIVERGDLALDLVCGKPLHQGLPAVPDGMLDPSGSSMR